MVKYQYKALMSNSLYENHTHCDWTDLKSLKRSIEREIRWDEEDSRSTYYIQRRTVEYIDDGKNKSKVSSEIVKINRKLDILMKLLEDSNMITEDMKKEIDNINQGIVVGKVEWVGEVFNTLTLDLFIGRETT